MLELDRLKCIQGLIDRQLKQKAVAERLGLTVRQVRQLVERYELESPRGLISKLWDRAAASKGAAAAISPGMYGRTGSNRRL